MDSNAAFGFHVLGKPFPTSSLVSVRRSSLLRGIQPRVQSSKHLARVRACQTELTNARHPGDSRTVLAGEENDAQVGTLASVTPNSENWRTSLVCGVVVEVWLDGRLQFGVVSEAIAVRSLQLVLVDTKDASPSLDPNKPVKIAIDQVICVWPTHLCPDLSLLRGTESTISSRLASDVEAGKEILKQSRPRSLNLMKAYEFMHRFNKSDRASRRTSFQVASIMFPNFMRGPRERRAAATTAAAMLLAVDNIRFRRAEPGLGWRTVAPSVVATRTQSSFIEACKWRSEPTTPARERSSPWSREHLEILRELEICAASGTKAEGSSASALIALGYEPTDDGAATLLLDVGYWASGTLEKDGGGTTQEEAASAAPPRIGYTYALSTEEAEQYERSAEESYPYLEENPVSDEVEPITGSKNTYARQAAFVNETNESEEQVDSFTDHSAVVGEESSPSDAGSTYPSIPSGQTIRDWTFPPSILAEARELRAKARERRGRYLDGEEVPTSEPRRNILLGLDGRSKLRVYCIDDKNARFLDDAVSVEVIRPGRLLRVYIHIADVDEIVRSGSALDELARERGQSLYLPLKPLHMLPAAAMDAASFSTAFPNEGITAAIDVDISSGDIKSWEIFASLVPPVIRVNYNQFDAALEGRDGDVLLSNEILRDLRRLGEVGPVLAEKLDTRRNGRRYRRAGFRLDGNANGTARESLPEEVGFASVRLVRRREHGSRGSPGKYAEVVDFRTTGAYAIIADFLLSASMLFREYAHRHGAFLPEDRSAAQYVSRCGTAPMRRYADLSIQRQIKCILFGRQPAGRRRMEELRTWLAKRYASGEKTVTSRRRAALYTSLADHCFQQQSASNLPYAVLSARIRSVNIRRRRIVRAEVAIEGTGLFAVAAVAKSLSLIGSRSVGSNETLLGEDTEDEFDPPLKIRDRVLVQISEVDTSAQKIVAEVVSKLD